MASQEFHALQAHMAAQPPPPDDLTLEQRRAGIDATMGALPLADGTESSDGALGGVPVVDVRPSGSERRPVILYLHGGGFRMGSALAWRAYASHLANAADARVVVVDYRLAPEHPFPAPLDDVVAAYRALLESGVDASRIVPAGDSAGGNLAAALVLALKEAGDPLPAGVVCCSPWVDLTNSADTYRSRAEVDRLFSLASATEATESYVPATDPRQPLVSPVFGEWSGGPPALIQVGDAEVLLDDARALADVMGAAGVDVELRHYDEMPHVWQLSYPAFPEAVEGVREIGAFVQRVTRSA